MVNSALFITRFYNEEHITWRGYVIGFELFFLIITIFNKTWIFHINFIVLSSEAYYFLFTPPLHITI